VCVWGGEIYLKREQNIKTHVSEVVDANNRQGIMYHFCDTKN
jgi:hypothetical protein